MSDIGEIIKKLVAFRDERDWAKFHDPKNLAAALSIEAAELNELYLWKSTTEEINAVAMDKVADELADVMAFTLLMIERLGLDPIDILETKIKKNADKYPADRAAPRPGTTPRRVGRRGCGSPTTGTTAPPAS